MIHFFLLLLIKIMASAIITVCVKFFYHPPLICRRAYIHGFQDGLLLGLTPDGILLFILAIILLRRLNRSRSSLPR